MQKKCNSMQKSYAEAEDMPFVPLDSLPAIIPKKDKLPLTNRLASSIEKHTEPIQFGDLWTVLGLLVLAVFRFVFSLVLVLLLCFSMLFIWLQKKLDNLRSSHKEEPSLEFNEAKNIVNNIQINIDNK